MMGLLGVGFAAHGERRVLRLGQGGGWRMQSRRVQAWQQWEQQSRSLVGSNAQVVCKDNIT